MDASNLSLKLAHISESAPVHGNDDVHGGDLDISLYLRRRQRSVMYR